MEVFILMKTNTFEAQIGTSLELACSFLYSNLPIGIPTETVYGLAANAYEPMAVARIFEIKNRPTFDPLIVHTYSIEALSEFTKAIHPKAMLLAERFWPGPLTLLLPKNHKIPDLVTSGLPNVGVRIPAHPVTLDLLRSLPFPLAAPSANPFGYISPTTATHVKDQLSDKIPYILEGGKCTIGVESTIVGFDEYLKPTIFRLGGISIEEIEAVIGKVEIKPFSSSNPHAPGMLKSHYAPRTPFFIVQRQSFYFSDALNAVGTLCFREPFPNIPKAFQKVLSTKGCLKEAAHNLFCAMRELDSLGLEAIFCELVPDVGLGKAINDRLKRAAAK
ncbi:MAG: L-threonylcarbamoyladenylate synthase [Bacteroidia bacterium]|nr:L-threonylcarbamoyladenylate synthase [Bacteroidia bacterium]MDW8159002.1 L-threonylcarbamoyladenylate synthase [Bacteroidia bacterium]